MQHVSQFPPFLLGRALRMRLGGRIHFPGETVGEVIEGDDEAYRVFRKMVADPTDAQPARPGAGFEVGFRFKRFSPAVNRWLSLIPMPFIAAQPGFRSKTWLLGRDTGAFKGIYEWDTVEDAENYWTSLPMRLMRRRAAAGTLTRHTWTTGP